MIEEIILDGYLQWPALEDDLIKVMCWVGDEPVETHKHDFIEIAFIAQGTCAHGYHDSQIRLIPGDLFVITPHEEHSYKISSKTVIYNCLFYPEALGEDWNRLKGIESIYDLLIVEPFYRPESGKQEILHLSPPEAEYIELVLKRMVGEQEDRLEGFELVQKSNLIVFLCMLGRVWKKQFGEKNNIYLNRRDMLAGSISFIENNIINELKIDDLASKAYLSPNYFRKIFKETTGLTPIDYINGIRISKAREFLGTGRMSVTEVGEAVGIRDLNYFSKIFKSMVGCSPSSYKKMFKKY